MKVERLMYDVSDTPACIYLKWLTYDRVDYSLRQVTGSLVERGLRSGIWLWMNHLQSLQGCVNGLEHILQLFSSLKFRGHCILSI